MNFFNQYVILGNDNCDDDGSLGVCDDECPSAVAGLFFPREYFDLNM